MIKQLTVCFILGLFLGVEAIDRPFCRNIKSQFIPDSNLAYWYPPSTLPPKGVALFIHGLNLLPSKMDKLAQEFTQKGVIVLRLSLQGHRGDIEEFKRVKSLDWIQEALWGYCTAQAVADYYHIPHYFVGYSLGAVLAIYLLQEYLDEIYWNKMVFLAPMLGPRWYTYIMKYFSNLNQTWVIPSRNLPGYRANEGTPLTAYRAFWKILNQVESREWKKSFPPTLLVVDRKDDLISFEKIEQKIKQYGLLEWNLLTIDREVSDIKIPYHLLVDPYTMGNSVWIKFLQAVNHHLGWNGDGDKEARERTFR